VLGEPLHPRLGVAIPLGIPGWNGRFPSHFLVELFAEEVGAFANDEAAIVGPVWEEVHETLEAAEARFGRVLVLMGPGDVLGEIGPAYACGWVST